MTQKKKIIIIVSAVVGGLLALYLGLALYFTSHFYFRTTINGVDISGRSVAAAKTTFQNHVDAYELLITERDESTESIIGKDVALQMNWNHELEDILDSQNGFDWIIKLFKPEQHETDAHISYDAVKLNELLRALPCMASEKQIAPKNAGISDYSIGKGYQLVPAVEGTEIDYDAFYKNVEDCIYELKTELNLHESMSYVQPEIADDDENLLAALDQLNTALETVITYQVGNETQVLDATVFHSWLVVNDKLEVSLDDEQLTAYVKELASTYNTFGKAKKLMTSYGTEVTISNSHYGWKVDQAAEKQAIRDNIMAGEQISRDLEYAVTAHSRGVNDYGDSYVEINLTAQHLFLYVDGALVLDTDFVSGNISKGHITPTGAFRLTYKTRNATLRGRDYESFVNYWMPYAGNVGMHDATWRKEFGKDIYKTNGSHGCVNLPLKSAKVIYEHISEGFPVFVYQLPGTEPVVEVPPTETVPPTEAVPPTETAPPVETIPNGQ